MTATLTTKDWLAQKLNSQDPKDQELVKWYNSRPEVIRKAIENHPPGWLYRLKTSNHLVTLESYSDQTGQMTMTVAVTRDFNLVVMQRAVFGIKPEDLEPVCPLTDCEAHKTNLPESIRKILDNLDLEVQGRMSGWHEELDKTGILAGPARAEAINEMVNDFIIEYLAHRVSWRDRKGLEGLRR